MTAIGSMWEPRNAWPPWIDAWPGSGPPMCALQFMGAHSTMYQKLARRNQGLQYLFPLRNRVYALRLFGGGAARAGPAALAIQESSTHARFIQTSRLQAHGIRFDPQPAPHTAVACA